MWRSDCQIRSGYSSSLLRSSFIVVLMMSSLAAYGELEVSAFGWSYVGGNGINIDVEVSGLGACQGTGKVDFPNRGFGFGLAYWFPGVPILGAGLDLFQADHGDIMNFLAVDICLLFRLQFDQNTAFPNGRIIAYFGAGSALQKLEGPVPIPADFDSSNEVGAELQSFGGLVLKAGWEGMILSWLAIFVEGRYISGTMEGQKKGYEVVNTWFGPAEQEVTCVNAAAKLSIVQLILGIALHI